MSFEMDAHAGEKLSISTAEVLDKDGNFYTANYRSARSQLHYICHEGHQSYKPKLTFFGFRYLRIDEAPEAFTAENIHAIVLHSEMKRTGWLESSDTMLNQLFSNILWGQKGNYLDIPTDCPQRDERYGWTGDGQIFCRAGTYQYDVRQFFRKWLNDMKAAQHDNGWVPEVIPSLTAYQPGGAAWSDAVTIIPWQLYETYGDISFVSDMYDAMKKWIAYIPTVSKTPDLFTGCWTYGDWLALDHPEGYVPPTIELSKRGYSNDDLVYSAFYANSVHREIYFRSDGLRRITQGALLLLPMRKTSSLPYTAARSFSESDMSVHPAGAGRSCPPLPLHPKQYKHPEAAAIFKIFLAFNF